MAAEAEHGNKSPPKNARFIALTLRMHRLLCLLAALLLLSGCSAVRLGYGNADTLARWMIDDYVDLSPEQDVLVRERLARFHGWHRKTQLPDYVVLLGDVQQFVAGQPQADDALVLLRRMFDRGKTFYGQATPDVADFVRTLTPSQIDRMAERFTKKNAEFSKTMKLAETEAEQRKAYLKRTLERSEYWFGSFSNEQEKALQGLVAGQVGGLAFWYDDRLRRQREWLELVRKVAQERLSRERTIELLATYEKRFLLDSEKTQALRRKSAEFTVAIHALTTPEQRAHARHKLDDLMKDLTELSRES